MICEGLIIAFRLEFPVLFQKAKTRILPKGEFRFSNSHFCLTVAFDHQISLLDNAILLSQNYLFL